MTRSKVLTLGAGFCKTGLYLLAIGFVLQLLDQFFYIVTNNRLFYLGAAFVLTFVLCFVLRIMARQSRQHLGIDTMGYPPLMVPAEVNSRHFFRGRR